MKASVDEIRSDYYKLTESFARHQLILGTISLIPLTYLIIAGGICGYGIVEIAVVLVAWKIFSGVAGLVGSAYGSKSVHQALPVRHNLPRAGYDFFIIVVILMVIGVNLSLGSIFYMCLTAKLACPGGNTGFLSLLAFLSLYIVADVVLLVKAAKSAKRPAEDEAEFEPVGWPLILDEFPSKAPVTNQKKSGFQTHFLQNSNWVHMVQSSDKNSLPLASAHNSVSIDFDGATEDEVEVFPVTEYEEAYFMNAEPSCSNTVGYAKVGTP